MTGDGRAAAEEEDVEEPEALEPLPLPATGSAVTQNELVGQGTEQPMALHA